MSCNSTLGGGTAEEVERTLVLVLVLEGANQEQGNEDRPYQEMPLQRSGEQVES